MAAAAAADDLRGEQPAIPQRNHFLPPALGGDIGEGFDLLPGLAAVSRAPAFAAHQCSRRGADDGHEAVTGAVGKGGFLAGLRIVEHGAIRQRQEPRGGRQLDEGMADDAVNLRVGVLAQVRRRAPRQAVIAADREGDMAGLVLGLEREPDIPRVNEPSIRERRERAGIDRGLGRGWEERGFGPRPPAISRAGEEVGPEFAFAKHGDQHALGRDAQRRVNVPADIGFDADWRG